MAARVPRRIRRHPQPGLAARVAHLDEAREAGRRDQRRALRQLEIVGDRRGARAHHEQLLGVVAAREPHRVDALGRRVVHQRAVIGRDAAWNRDDFAAGMRAGKVKSAPARTTGAASGDAWIARVRIARASPGQRGKFAAALDGMIAPV